MSSPRIAAALVTLLTELSQFERFQGSKYLKSLEPTPKIVPGALDLDTLREMIAKARKG